ncbi:KR domain family protein [Aspergillus tubingensis]|uniref:KR domain family protein n=1 Tax=Aspergillus tubingensis TaxID=5068 RepID=UPI001579E1F1|nr:KR domain family protein [Aspergillus tubingensis]GFN14759.1 KR domain family protein [Aspergillus tubingensis]
MRFSVISVSLLSLFASSALAIPSASGTLSCSDVSSELSGYEQRLAKATDTSSPKYQAAQNLIDSAKNLESADCGSSSKRSYYPPESTGLIGEILNAVDSLVTRGSRSVNDQPITEKRDARRRAWDRPDQVPSQSRRTMEGCNVQDDLDPTWSTNEQNPSSLDSLCEFLSTPRSDQQTSRLGVLEFTHPNCPPVYRKIDHQCLLRDLVSEETNLTESGSLYGRIVLVENISRGIVEILGSTLGIDPLFFKAHIGRNGCSRNPMFEYADDSSQQFLTCHYPRAITLEGVQGSVESENYVRQINVDRDALLLHSTPENTFNALIQHRCSVWVKSYQSGGWLALILVDPPVLNGGFRLTPESSAVRPITTSGCRLFQGGNGDTTGTLLPDEGNRLSDPFSEGDSSSCPPRDGLFDDLIYYWTNRPASFFDITRPPMSFLAYSPIQIALAEWKNSHIAMVLFLRHFDSELIRRAVRKKLAEIKKDPEDCTRPPKQSESSVSNLTGFRRWFMSTINPPQAHDKTTQPRKSSEKKTRKIYRSDPMFQIFMTMRTWIMPIITQNYRDIKYLRSQTLALPPIIDSYDDVINSLGQFASALDTILPCGKEFANDRTNTIIPYQRNF